MPAWFYALVLVRRGDRFLLVEETDHGGGWYVPAGRVEPGESLTDAALREVREEAGIDVRLTGVYRCEHTVFDEGVRLRVIFAAEPVDETLRADWFTPEEAGSLRLRADEVSSLLALAAATLPAALDVVRSIVR